MISPKLITSGFLYKNAHIIVMVTEVTPTIVYFYDVDIDIDALGKAGYDTDSVTDSMYIDEFCHEFTLLPVSEEVKHEISEQVQKEYEESHGSHKGDGELPILF